MSTTNTILEKPPTKLKRANEVMAGCTAKPPALLFDEFWREGEVALLFGPAGVGKSLLAVTLADALARGRPIAGLDMPTRPRNVLYVDLVLSDDQFTLRYSCEGRHKGRRRYKFSERLFLGRPAANEELINWLRTVVLHQKIRTVIIDDLSVISRSDDGTRETLKLVTALRQMTREIGISVLVLADSLAPVYERDVGERDLRRTRVLCGYADSVFALEPVGATDRRHLIQTRAQSCALHWTTRRPAHFTLTSRDDGFVGFEFDEPAMTPQERDLICRIKRMREHGDTFRSIADELAMSKSTVARLYAKSGQWAVAGGQEKSGQWSVDSGQVKSGECSAAGGQEGKVVVAEQAAPVDVRKSSAFPDGVLTDPGGCAFGDGRAGEALSSDDGRPQLFRRSSGEADEDAYSPAFDPHTKPFLASLRRRSVYDLPRGTDAAGREIFIENLEHHTRRPQLWYTIDATGHLTRHERKMFGIHLERLGRTEYI